MRGFLSSLLSSFNTSIWLELALIGSSLMTVAALFYAAQLVSLIFIITEPSP